MIVRIQGASEYQNGIYYEYDNESQPLGQGGMGIVYEGRCFRVSNPDEYIPVAIKLITNNAPELIDRAMKEAEVQVDHPNLLRMWGFIPNMERNGYGNDYITRYYVVMDRLIGVDMYNIINGNCQDLYGNTIGYAQQLYHMFQNDRLEFVKTVMLDTIRGLEKLHEMGYIHRDVDPSNIMVTNEGQIKLIDFGICKRVGTNTLTERSLTQTGAIIGKLDYAAPELILGDVNNHNVTTDVYALGILLYQLYTGTLPFTGTNNDIMQAQLKDNVPVKNVDDTRLRKIIAKATQKQQHMRYQSVVEMMMDLDSVSSVPPVPPIPVDGGSDGTIIDDSVPIPNPDRGSNIIIAILSVILTILGLVLGYLMYTNDFLNLW